MNITNDVRICRFEIGVDTLESFFPAFSREKVTNRDRSVDDDGESKRERISVRK